MRLDNRGVIIYPVEYRVSPRDPNDMTVDVFGVFNAPGHYDEEKGGKRGEVKAV